MPALLLSTRVFGPRMNVAVAWQPAVPLNEAYAVVHEVSPPSPTRSSTLFAPHVPFVVIVHLQLHASFETVGSLMSASGVVVSGQVVGRAVANVTIEKPGGTANPHPPSHTGMTMSPAPPSTSDASPSTFNRSKPETRPHPSPTDAIASVMEVRRRKVPQ